MPRRSLLLVIATVGVLAAAAVASSWPLRPQFKGPPKVIAEFGYIKSLKLRGNAFELRFDAAQWLQGLTAQRAAVEDGAIEPGDPVPNDYYILNPDRRLTTYRVPKGVPVTVVTTVGPVGATRIGVAELAHIIRGKNPRNRPLMDRGNHLGFWLSIRIDTVRSIDQQYQP